MSYQNWDSVNMKRVKKFKAENIKVEVAAEVEVRAECKITVLEILGAEAEVDAGETVVENM